MRASARLLGSMAVLVAPLAAAPAQVLPQTTTDANTVSNLPNTEAADRNAKVRQEDRSSASLAPVGAHFGSFTLFPKVEGAVIYDSNIYALERPTNDFIAKLSPSLTLNGDAGLYKSTIRLALDRYNYFSKTRENRTDLAIGGKHSYELAPETLVTANGAFSRNHEDRGDPNANTTNLRPTVYKLYEAGAGLSRDLSTLRLGVDGGFRRYDYDDARQIGGGLTNNQGRDRNLYRIGGRVGVEFSPGYTLVGRVVYDSVDYDQRIAVGGFNRNSTGYRASAGVGFELTRLLTGEVYGGYLHRSYDDVRFRNVNKPLFGAALAWFPTELATVRVNIDRSVEETVIVGFSGYLATSVSLNWQYELMRTVMLTGGGRYSRNDYQRSAVAGIVPRQDDNYGLSLGVRYILNRNLYTSLGYDYSARQSTATVRGSDFKRNKVLATIGVQF